MAINEEEVRRAEARMKERMAESRAVFAYYNEREGNIIVELSTGFSLIFPPQHIQGLQDALPVKLTEIEITPTGLGLHFPQLDADIYIPALLQGALGSRSWMAQQFNAAAEEKISATAPISRTGAGIIANAK